MNLEKVNILHYRDTWGGKNYGCYPINTQGKSLKEKLDTSELWSLIKKDGYIDKRNDNQCDIHRGSDFIYEQNSSGKIISIYMNKSRSGKTVNWEFHCNFHEKIEV